MRITWVGVPIGARGRIRARLRLEDGDEFLVCSEKGANQRARREIRECLWAFKPEFIDQCTKGILDGRAIEALEKMQKSLCEDANELVFSMLRSFKSFWRAAVAADGRGHFLSRYDGREVSYVVDGTPFYFYRQN